MSDNLAIPCACGRLGCSFVRKRSDQRFSGNACRIYHCRQKKKFLEMLGKRLKTHKDIFNALDLYAPISGLGERELPVSSHYN